MCTVPCSLSRYKPTQFDTSPGGEGGDKMAEPIGTQSTQWLYFSTLKNTAAPGHWAERADSWPPWPGRGAVKDRRLLEGRGRGGGMDIRRYWGSYTSRCEGAANTELTGMEAACTSPSG